MEGAKIWGRGIKIDFIVLLLFFFLFLQNLGSPMPPTPLSPKHPPAQKGIMYAQSCNTEHFFPLQYGLLQGIIETSGKTRFPQRVKPVLE